jgi:hypothetical protein
MIKEFQSRGLFGPRDIHKLIVKIPFPKYQKGTADHEALAALARDCASLAANFVSVTKAGDLEPRALGKVRARLKDQLAPQLSEIDRIVEKLSAGMSAGQQSRNGKSRRSGSRGRLFD